MADKKIGDITVYEDDDGKAVWEFEGKVQSDTPLDTKAQDFAGAINELFSYGGEGGEEWTPPDWWLEVPEPKDYEINLLVNIYGIGTASNAPNKIKLQMATSDGEFWAGQGPLTVDWGDGTIDSYAHNRWGSVEHSYTKTGQYVIRAEVTEQSNFLQQIVDNATLLIAKLGDKIIINDGSGTSSYQRAFYGRRALCWVKFNGTGGLPYYHGFDGDIALKRIDMTVPPEVIPQNTFANTNYGGKFDFSQVVKIESYGLQNTTFKKLNLPKCVEIEHNGISDNFVLEEISAPICTAVGNSAFSMCQKLSKAEFAEDCEYGTNCFSGCLSLTPRPDGSII